MDYPNSGALWPPKNRTSDKAPNLRGSVKIEVDMLKELMSESDGLVEIELAGWTKDYNGKKFLSLKVSKPYKKDDAPPPADDQDDLPF